MEAMGRTNLNAVNTNATAADWESMNKGEYSDHLIKKFNEKIESMPVSFPRMTFEAIYRYLTSTEILKLEYKNELMDYCFDKHVSPEEFITAMDNYRFYPSKNDGTHYLTASRMALCEVIEAKRRGTLDSILSYNGHTR